MPALGGRGRGSEFNVIFDYIVNWRAAWATHETLSPIRGEQKRVQSKERVAEAGSAVSGGAWWGQESKKQTARPELHACHWMNMHKCRNDYK